MYFNKNFVESSFCIREYQNNFDFTNFEVGTLYTVHLTKLENLLTLVLRMEHDKNLPYQLRVITGEIIEYCYRLEIKPESSKNENICTEYSPNDSIKIMGGILGLMIHDSFVTYLGNRIFPSNKNEDILFHLYRWKIKFVEWEIENRYK